VFHSVPVPSIFFDLRSVFVPPLPFYIPFIFCFLIVALPSPYIHRQGVGIFPFTTASKPPLGPTQPPIQWVSGALSLGVKRPGREADHTRTSSAEVKECAELYLHPQYAFIAWCSIKARILTSFDLNDTNKVV
jgi:hypothetical protein